MTIENREGAARFIPNENRVTITNKSAEEATKAVKHGIRVYLPSVTLPSDSLLTKMKKKLHNMRLLFANTIELTQKQAKELGLGTTRFDDEADDQGTGIHVDKDSLKKYLKSIYQDPNKEKMNALLNDSDKIASLITGKEEIPVTIRTYGQVSENMQIFNSKELRGALFEDSSQLEDAYKLHEKRTQEEEEAARKKEIPKSTYGEPHAPMKKVASNMLKSNEGIQSKLFDERSSPVTSVKPQKSDPAKVMEKRCTNLRESLINNFDLAITHTALKGELEAIKEPFKDELKNHSSDLYTIAKKLNIPDLPDRLSVSDSDSAREDLANAVINELISRGGRS